MRKWLNKFFERIGLGRDIEIDDFARLKIAQIRANNLLESFNTIKNELEDINKDLSDIVTRTDDEIEILKQELEQKLYELYKLKKDTQLEIEMNNKVIARLKDFTR